MDWDRVWWVQTLNSYSNSIEYINGYETLQEAEDAALDYARKWPCEEVYVTQLHRLFIDKGC